MTTPLIIIAILTMPYVAARLWVRLTDGSFDPDNGAIVGLSMAFAFFGIGHFAETDAMAQMLPVWVPYRTPVIYLTGVLEWSLAIVLLVPASRHTAGWACIAILILFFPANIYAALNGVGMGGHQWGPIYLLIRAPLQLILIGWSYWFVARRPAS
jgi:uncharacterized membrane protein